MQRNDQTRASMMSVPVRWSVLYFNIFTIICLSEWGFLVWYEVSGRGAASDYIDVAMTAIIGIGAVGLAAGIQTFIILKVRDWIMVTWETYSRRRYAKGKEEGIEEGIEIGVERGKRQTLQAIERLLEEGNGSHVLNAAAQETQDLEELLDRIRRDPVALEKLLAMIRKAKTDDTG